MVKQDISRVFRSVDGGWWRKMNACLRSPGLQAVLIFRFGHWIHYRNLWLKILLQPFYVLLNYRVKANWGIEIHSGAEIGEGLYIPHYGGIFVDTRTRIGKDCSIGHEVTIGLSGSGDRSGAPVIGDCVVISPGAKLVGKIRIGNNVKIGPNAVVLNNVPDNARVIAEGTRTVLFALALDDGNRTQTTTTTVKNVGEVPEAQ